MDLYFKITCLSVFVTMGIIFIAITFTPKGNVPLWFKIYEGIVILNLLVFASLFITNS